MTVSWQPGFSKDGSELRMCVCTRVRVCVLHGTRSSYSVTNSLPNERQRIVPSPWISQGLVPALTNRLWWKRCYVPSGDTASLWPSLLLRLCLSSFSLLPFSPLLPLVSLCLSVSGILSSFVSSSLFFSHSLSPSLFLECLPSQTYCHGSEEFGTHGEVTVHVSVEFIQHHWIREWASPLLTLSAVETSHVHWAWPKVRILQQNKCSHYLKPRSFEVVWFSCRNWNTRGRKEWGTAVEHLWKRPWDTAVRGAWGVVKRLSADTGHVSVGCPWEVGMRHANKMKKITLEDREKGILASHRKNNCPACVDVENGKCTQEAGQPS